MKSEKIVNNMIKHPCITTFLLSILVYPIYFIIYTCFIFMMPVYNNILNPYSQMRVGSGWAIAAAVFALVPWILNTTVFVITSKNPFGKFSDFVQKYQVIIQSFILYVPIALLIDATFDRFMLSSHLALITVIALLYTIGFVIRLITRHKIRKELQINI